VQSVRATITWPARRISSALGVRRSLLGVLAGVGAGLSTLAEILTLERPNLLVILILAVSGVLLLGVGLMQPQSEQGSATSSVRPGVVVPLAHQGVPRYPA
jgi:hypothetical protein